MKDGFNTYSIGVRNMNRNFLVTTGHGGIRVGDIMYEGRGNRRIEVVTDVVFNGRMDASRVSLDSGANYNPTATKHLYRSLPGLPVNTSVSQNSGISGRRNGRILSNSYSYVGNGHVWTDLYHTNMTTVTGDSGGSLFEVWNSQWYVIGIIHASLGNNGTLSANVAHLPFW